MQLSDSIIKIKGIGEKTAQGFHKLDIFSVNDLLEHYPREYEFFSDIEPISQAKEGMMIAIEASLIRRASVKKVRNLKILECMVSDGTGSISLTWFNMPFLINQLKLGTRYIFRGKLIRKNGMLSMDQPKIYTKQEFYKYINTLQPVYSLTASITNHMILKSVQNALSEVSPDTDYMTKDFREKYHLAEYKKALKGIHFPKSKEECIECRNRIVFDEFFFYILALNQLKKNKIKHNSKYIFSEVNECDDLIKQLPYQLTNAQMSVWDEIKKDVCSGKIMNRLIQGDVGSGKTILAILALLLTVKNGKQGVLMVPTEVLANQHFEELKKLLSDYYVNTGLLVGSLTQKEKREMYEKIKTGEIDLVIGTHAVIQEKVEFHELAMVITDEQHRFGVKQRETLTRKGREPHVLVMSATPIPRTLAIILYGDLDLSVINELPVNRLPIKNCVVNTNYRETAYRFIEKEVRQGRQAYIICPMVEESESIELENVIDYSEKLKEMTGPDLLIEYLHGKMNAKEKNECMERFSSGKIDVLISTTVIEVGINVPNATVIMIENAERFGLAQLHQLRGRVGRGKDQSYCILMSGTESKDAMERLGILNKSNDGFFIASEDLKMRGPGDLFGIKQSGDLNLKIGDIYQDAEILKKANEAAKEINEKELEKLKKRSRKLTEKLKLMLNDIQL